MKRNITKQLCTCAAVFEVYDMTINTALLPSDSGRFQMTGIRQTYRITRLVYPDAKQRWFDLYSHEDPLRSTDEYYTMCVVLVAKRKETSSKVGMQASMADAAKVLWCVFPLSRENHDLGTTDTLPSLHHLLRRW